MSQPPVVSLEMGTSKFCALVGEQREDGQIMITGIGESPARGVRKGEIIDVENAMACARAALQGAEDSAQVAIRQVFVSVAGGHVQQLVNRGSVPVLDPGGVITGDDIDQVVDLARAVNLPVERDLLHSVSQRFLIDDHDVAVNPEGMEGAKLSLDMLVLHGIRSRLRTGPRVLKNLGLDVVGIGFGGLCSALAVLTDEQKERGALVIDIGGGTTDYVVYADDVLALAGSLAVGGDHVTNDIALAFSIPTMQAENLKRESGAAIVDLSNRSQRVAVPPDVGFPGAAINLYGLQTAASCRVEETFAMIKQTVVEQNLLHRLGAGVVLTGGGSRLKRIDEQAERVFGRPCSVGGPRGISGLAKVTESPDYATAVGLVKYGFIMDKDSPRGFSISRWLSGLFGASA